MMKKYRKTIAKIFVLLVVGILVFSGTISMYQHVKEEQALKTAQEVLSEKGTNLLNGNWDYMPGIETSETGLLVSPTELAIINKNQKAVQKNPPINIAGTYLDQVKGNFSLNAIFSLKNDTKAEFSFYGRVPIIADEFIIERESIKVVFEKGRVQITVVDTNSREKTIGTYTYKENNYTKFTLKSINDTLIVVIDDNEVAKIPNQNVFGSEQIWLGLAAENSSWDLRTFTAEKLEEGSFVVKNASDERATKRDLEGLQRLASQKRSDFIVGTSVASNPLFTDQKYKQVVLDPNNFGSLTPENGMKMFNLQPLEGTYTFAYTDALVSQSKQNNQTIHGHTLVFGEANPQWVTSLPVDTFFADLFTFFDLNHRTAILNCSTNNVELLMRQYTI